MVRADRCRENVWAGSNNTGIFEEFVEMAGGCTVWMRSLTIKWHILQSDWSVRPITTTAFLCNFFLIYFGKIRHKSNVCII